MFSCGHEIWFFPGPGQSKGSPGTRAHRQHQRRLTRDETRFHSGGFFFTSFSSWMKGSFLGLFSLLFLLRVFPSDLCYYSFITVLLFESSAKLDFFQVHRFFCNFFEPNSAWLPLWQTGFSQYLHYLWYVTIIAHACHMSLSMDGVTYPYVQFSLIPQCAVLLYSTPHFRINFLFCWFYCDETLLCHRCLNHEWVALSRNSSRSRPTSPGWVFTGLQRAP